MYVLCVMCCICTIVNILIIFYHLKLLINSNILKLLINFNNKLRENWRSRDEIILTILKYNAF